MKWVSPGNVPHLNQRQLRRSGGQKHIQEEASDDRPHVSAPIKM
jgi:hypothetical protein